MIVLKTQLKLILALTSVGLMACTEVGFKPTEKAINAIFADHAIVINGGDPYTQSQDVVVSIQSTPKHEMYVTNDPTCLDGGEWLGYEEQQDWILDQDNAIAKVYVQFRTSDGWYSKCINDDIIHDNIPPRPSYQRAPRAMDNNKIANFQLHARDNISGVAGFQCQDASGSYSPCNSSTSINGLSEGPNQFHFVAYDRAGNQSAPLNHSWFTDYTPPVAKWKYTPPALTNKGHADFMVEATDALTSVVEYQCKLDQGVFKKCNDKPSVNKVQDGVRHFQVRVRDEAGNWSETINYQWVVDRMPPQVIITSAPKQFSNKRSSHFTFKSLDVGSSVEKYLCSVDGSAYNTCTTPLQLGLFDGNHRLEVRAVDRAGNESIPATHNWMIDTVRPVVSIASAPAKLGNEPAAKFTLNASDKGSGIAKLVCTLDGKTKDCSTQVDYSQLVSGTHKFSVTAYDKAENASDPANYEWVVDLLPPLVKITKAPKNWSNLDQELIAFEGVDQETSIVLFECQLDAGDFSPCTSEYATPKLPDGEHQFSVRATDEVGNVSVPASHKWMIDRESPKLVWLKTQKDHSRHIKAQLKFKATDKTSGIDTNLCQHNGKFINCENNSMIVLTGLSEGSQTLKVTTTDKAGNSASIEHSWYAYERFKPVQQNIDATGTQIDVLFVVDNSDSMKMEQKSMSERIKYFVPKLENLDWRIAVTSTDYRESQPFGAGKLKAFDNGNYYLDNLVGSTEAQRLLGRAMTLGVGGHAEEQGIGGTYRFIERQVMMDVNSPRHMLRDNSQLAVVLISDENEVVKDYHNSGRNLTRFIEHNWGGKKKFVFNSIIVRPGDESCLEAASYKYFGHKEGDAYAALSEATNGVIGNVCAKDYSSQIKKIGDSVRQKLTMIELSCEPRDVDGDGKVDLKITLEGPGTIPTYTVKGNKVHFATGLPEGNHSVEYFCDRPRS